MKKFLVGMAALGAASMASTAMAASACTGTAGNGTAVTAATDGTLFVRNAFTPKCSANITVKYTDQVTGMAVGSGSSKGKNTFAGNTAGGAVSASGTCAASGCTTEIDTALTAAEALTS